MYPINEEIERLLAEATDPETGEVLIPDEELEERIEQLQMDFDNLIINLRNSHMQDMMDAGCIEAEAKALREMASGTQKRADVKKNKAERTKRLLAWLLQGEKFDKDGVTISYRKSETCVIDEDFTNWAMANAPELLKVEPKKADIKTALKSGTVFEFARLEKKNNIQIK